MAGYYSAVSKLRALGYELLFTYLAVPGWAELWFVTEDLLCFILQLFDMECWMLQLAGRPPLQALSEACWLFSCVKALRRGIVTLRSELI